MPSPTPPPADATFSRRAFVALTASAAAAGALASPGIAAARARNAPRSVTRDVFDVEERSVAEWQAALARGELTSRQLVERYLQRIESLDAQGPKLRAVLETNPDALDIAAALDAERRAGKLRGPLHGIPVLVKDNIDTADRMHTTAGSLALAGDSPTRDAFVVERLRAAGAIVLGKTNLSEWANFRSTHSSSGWSARGGQARNPYALDRTPSGSSSGSAIAAAANYCTVAVGTETDGSITSPVGGVLARRAQADRRAGEPQRHRPDLAHAGHRRPDGRTVADAAVLLARARRRRSARRRDARARAPADYVAALDANGLKGARIGVAREKFTGYSVAGRRRVRARARRDEGSRRRDRRSGRHPDRRQVRRRRVRRAALRVQGRPRALPRDAPAGARARTLDDLIAFNRAHADVEMPYFGAGDLRACGEEGTAHERGVSRRRSRQCRQLSRTKGLDATFAKHRVDAIVAPTQGPPWLIDLVNGDPGRRKQHHALRRRRLSRDHGADGLRPRPAARHHLHGPRLERSHAAQARLRVRAGVEGEEGADVRDDGGTVVSA